MIIILFEICLLIGGIVVLVTGKMNLSANRVVKGAPARIIGVLFILPLPIAFAIFFAIGVAMAAGGAQDFNMSIGVAATIEIAIFALFIIPAVLIGAVYGKPPAYRDRWREDEDYEERIHRRRRDRDDDWDRPRRRARLEDDDDAPRRRPRREEEEDDDVITTEAVPSPRESIMAECPHCHRQLKFRGEFLGRSVRCPQCEGVFQAQAKSATVQEGVVEADRVSRKRHNQGEQGA